MAAVAAVAAVGAATLAAAVVAFGGACNFQAKCAFKNMHTFGKFKVFKLHSRCFSAAPC